MKTSHRNNHEAGGIVLEAALTLPFFLAFILALITMIQIAVTEMALQDAVTETVKETAHHYAPVFWISETAQDQAEQWMQSKAIPHFVQEWLSELVIGSLQEGVLPHIFTPIVRKTSDPPLIPARVSIASVNLPASDRPSDAYVEMIAQYRMPIVLPFFEKELVIQKKASERAWIGGSE